MRILARLRHLRRTSHPVVAVPAGAASAVASSVASVTTTVADTAMDGLGTAVDATTDLMSRAMRLPVQIFEDLNAPTLGHLRWSTKAALRADAELVEEATDPDEAEAERQINWGMG